EQIAEPMGISTRHLRRLLGQHGTSYERLRDEVRRDAALRLMTDPASSLTRIAYELGRSEERRVGEERRGWRSAWAHGKRQSAIRGSTCASVTGTALPATSDCPPSF